MGNYAEKMQKNAADVLRPGEQYLAAVRAAPVGTTTGMAVGGLVGAAVASRQASKAAGRAEGSLAASWPSGQSAVGLTNQRIVTFNFTAMGKPKNMTGEFPLEQIAGIDMDKKKITNALRISFVDGSVAEVEVKKLEKTDEFLDAFRSVKGGGQAMASSDRPLPPN